MRKHKCSAQPEKINHLKTMEEDWKKLAEGYDEMDWSFSSAFAWEKIVKENPKPFYLIQYVDQLRLSGNYSEAEQIISKIKIEEIPGKYQFVYHIRKGMLHEDQGEIEKAIESYRKSTQLKTDDTYPYIFLAAALSKRSKLDEAEEVFLEALKKEGDIDEVNYNLSFVYARKQDFKKAIAAIKECINLDPNYPNAKTWLADFENMENKMKNK
ncbi:MAG: tetratricopeptide repeat protein [Saprospiraceae bacterium]